MNKMFSTKIFKNTLKDLSLVALLIGLLSIAVTVLLITSGFSGGFYTRFYYFRIPYFRGEPIAISIAPILLAFMYLGTPALTFMAFKHQNNRVLSDKYHSLPFTRSQQFISRIVAVLVMVYTVIIITIVTALISLLASGTEFTMSYVIFNILGYIAGSTLMVGIVVLAMSVTGNIFANITVSALILFLPRCILMAMASLIGSVISGFINIGTLNIFYNPIMNIPIGLVLDQAGVWEYFGMSETLINPGSIIYTIVLGLIYLAAALLISQKRKSELAERSFAGTWQTATAAGLCSMPFLIICVYNIMTDIDITRFGRSTFIILGFALFLDIILIVIYSAGFKNIIKGIVVFAGIVILSGVLGITGKIIAENISNTKIDADQVDYIKIDLNYEKSYKNNPTYNYGELLFKDLEIKDEDIISAMTNALNDYVDTMYGRYESLKSGEGVSEYSYHDSVWCEYHLKNGRTIKRHLKMNINDDYNEIMSFVANQEILYMLPPLDDKTTYVTKVGEFGTNFYEYDYVNGDTNNYNELAKEIYTMYYNELNGYQSKSSSSTTNYGQTLHSFSDFYCQFSVDTMQIGGDIDNIAFSNYISLCDYTPETTTYYMQKVNEVLGTTIKDDIKTILEDPDQLVEFYVDGSIVSKDQQEYSDDHFYFRYSQYNEEDNQYSGMISDTIFDELCQLVLDTDLNSISVDTSYLCLYVNAYTLDDMENGEYYNYRPMVYIPINESQYDYWKAIVQDTEGLY